MGTTVARVGLTWVWRVGPVVPGGQIVARPFEIVNITFVVFRRKYQNICFPNIMTLRRGHTGPTDG